MTSIFSALLNTTNAGTYSPKTYNPQSKPKAGGKMPTGYSCSTKGSYTCLNTNQAEQASLQSIPSLIELYTQAMTHPAWGNGAGFDFAANLDRFSGSSPHIVHAFPQEPYQHINNR